MDFSKILDIGKRLLGTKAADKSGGWLKNNWKKIALALLAAGATYWLGPKGGAMIREYLPEIWKVVVG